MSRIALAPLFAVCSLLIAAPAGAIAPKPAVSAGPTARPRLSAALRELPGAFGPERFVEKREDRVNPLAGEPDRGRRGTWDRSSVPADPLAARGARGPGRAPAPDLTFEGTSNPTGCGGCSPPDTIGDVGPTRYVQLVNATKIAIYDKSGALQPPGPINLSTFWASGPCSSNDGDPVVAYDPLADRWVLSQFAGPHHLCFAVSTSPDPGFTYQIYEFDVSSFPDYFKIGVWPDGYYVSANQADYSAWVFERTKMLEGEAAGSQQASFPGGGGAANFLLPSDVDGLVAPPAGAPNLYYTFLDDSFHGGVDRLQLWEFHVDWTTPASSSFVNVASPPLAAFTYTVCGFFNFNCAYQPGTKQRVDALSEWPMHRFAYRNFGTYRSAVGTFTVGGGAIGLVSNKPTNAGAIVRWFELRDAGAGWSLYQEGTYDPPDTDDRFMSSVAQDRLGDLALGFSVSSKSVSPSIRYATRLADDPPGTLGAEATLIAGVGSQTGSNRWGDYSAMTVDPADDCTFWYTNEYYPATASTAWHTRIGSFRLPECAGLFFDNFETGGTSRWSAIAP